MNINKKASIYTFGCRLNQTESALLIDQLENNNFIVVTWGEPADLYIINSCSVTGNAANKTKQFIKQLRKNNPDSFIVLAGCGASNKEEFDYWQKSGLVNFILTNDKKNLLIENLPKELINNTKLLDNETFDFNPVVQLFKEQGVGKYKEKTRANLKIQEGCNFFCSYCIIPFVRGAPRSREWNDILREMKELLKSGYNEIVLAGINVATYNDNGRTLADLIRELLKFQGNFRLRLSSTEPGPVINDLISIMKEDSRFCRFLHLSVQYAENNILKSMNRRYTIEEYYKLTKDLTDNIPDICIGTDLIVGFPGETDETFNKCLENVKKINFSYIHIFTYSKRNGTKAATMLNQVPKSIAKKRHEELSKLVKIKSVEYSLNYIDKEVEILVEQEIDSENGNIIQGWTDNYLKVLVKTDKNIKELENTFIKVKISGLQDSRTLIGVQIEG